MGTLLSNTFIVFLYWSHLQYRDNTFYNDLLWFQILTVGDISFPTLLLKYQIKPHLSKNWFSWFCYCYNTNGLSSLYTIYFPATKRNKSGERKREETKKEGKETLHLVKEWCGCHDVLRKGIHIKAEQVCNHKKTSKFTKRILNL